MSIHFQRMTVTVILIGVALLTAGELHAEPALDRVLSGLQVSNQSACTALNIAFNLRVRYQSHFPLTSGEELRIAVRPIDPELAAQEISTRRESLRAPDVKFGRIRAIFFEVHAATGPTLVLQFDKQTNWKVTQGADFQSITVMLMGNAKNASCRSDKFAATNPGNWSTSVNRAADETPPPANTARVPSPASGNATDEQKRKAAGLLDEGRGALRKGDLAAAIAKFTTILRLPESDSTPEALELLGVAHQRNKQTEQARADYEAYLARYPNGSGKEGVQQRLDALAPPASAGDQQQLKAPKSADMKDGAQTWTVSGSASQFYIRDDSFKTVRDPSLPQAVNEDLDAHDVHQNELLTSLDAVATWSGNGVKSKLRFSGTEEHRFDDQTDIVGVAALFLDTSVKEWGFAARVGRQVRNSGGVLGRFDGGLFSFDLAEPFRLNMVAGSPVLRRRDAPFDDERYFYGASLDIGPFAGFDTTIFAIEQRDKSVLDRRAVGAEFRYVDSEKSAFATFDYDVHYNELNAAVLNGNWTLADKSTLHAGFDYRKSPYFSTWNALQGQVFPTLYEMLKAKTLAEIEELAIDRSATFTSASAGFARPLNDQYQVSLDATVTNFSGTPASDGVDAVEGTGNEYFYAGQLIGNGVYMNDDLLIAGLRFADLSKSNYYVADLSYRFPLMDSLKVNPRLMLGYRTGDTTDLVEYSVLPSVVFDYYMTKDWSFELEVGARWIDAIENGIEETSTDLFFTVGYRYDFYADGRVEGQSRAAPYGVGAAK